MKECNCNECDGYHERFCIMDTIIKGFNPEDCDCKSNDELVDGCIRCEERPADAEFPYNEYCNECAKDVIDDVKESLKLLKQDNGGK
jgi:hypothetical protein